MRLCPFLSRTHRVTSQYQSGLGLVSPRTVMLRPGMSPPCRSRLKGTRCTHTHTVRRHFKCKIVNCFITNCWSEDNHDATGTYQVTGTTLHWLLQDNKIKAINNWFVDSALTKYRWSISQSGLLPSCLTADWSDWLRQNSAINVWLVQSTITEPDHVKKFTRLGRMPTAVTVTRPEMLSVSTRWSATRW